MLFIEEANDCLAKGLMRKKKCILFWKSFVILLGALRKQCTNSPGQHETNGCSESPANTSLVKGDCLLFIEISPQN